jgi:hypothetical protein
MDMLQAALAVDAERIARAVKIAMKEAISIYARPMSVDPYAEDRGLNVGCSAFVASVKGEAT